MDKVYKFARMTHSQMRNMSRMDENECEKASRKPAGGCGDLSMPTTQRGNKVNNSNASKIKLNGRRSEIAQLLGISNFREYIHIIIAIFSYSIH